MNDKTYAEREKFNRVKVIVSPVGRQGRPGTPGTSIRFFDTLQEALDLQPRPENGVTFQVREDTDPENFGFYVFDDREEVGYRYLGERWDDEYLTQIENRIDAFEQEVGRRIEGAVSVKWFGAKGDGVTDDFLSIQDAVNSDFSRIIIGTNTADVYSISRPIRIPSNKKVVINGTVKLQDGYSAPMLSDVTIGDTSIFIQDADQYFFSGQQICVTDDGKQVQGGATGQTRKHAVALTIDSVDGNEITLTEVINQSFLTNLNAAAGHNQSCFIIENETNVIIEGTGIVDNNKGNQFDVEAVENLENDPPEDARFGCAVTFYNSTNILFTGVTVQNSILHNLNFKGCSYYTAENFTSDAAHDKNVLAWFSSKFKLHNITTTNADYEDGIILHNDCSDANISNIVAVNNGRYGVRTGSNCYNININNISGVDNATLLSIANSENINAKNLTSEGGGKRRYTQNNVDLVAIFGSKNIKVSFSARNSEFARSGLAILGESSDIVIEPIINNLTNGNGGYGIFTGAIGGVHPSDVTIVNPIISSTSLDFNLPLGATNVKVIGGTFSTIENGIGDEFKIFNTSQNENRLDGFLKIKEDSNGQPSAALAARIELDGYFGQPTILTTRTPGGEEFPTPLLQNNGIARIRSRAFDGVGYSSYVNFIALQATEDWEEGKHGSMLKIQTGRTGTSAGGALHKFFWNGLSVCSEIDEFETSSLLKVRQVFGEAFKLFEAVQNNGDTAFFINAEGKVRIGTSQDLSGAALDIRSGDVYIFGSGDRRFLVGENQSSSNFGGFKWNDTSKIISIGNSGSSTGLDDVEISGSGRVGIKNNPLNLKSYIVEELPSGIEGDLTYVTDANNVTYRGIATGGGTEKAMVFFDGTNWFYH